MKRKNIKLISILSSPILALPIVASVAYKANDENNSLKNRTPSNSHEWWGRISNAPRSNLLEIPIDTNAMKRYPTFDREALNKLLEEELTPEEEEAIKKAKIAEEAAKEAALEAKIVAEQKKNYETFVNKFFTSLQIEKFPSLKVFYTPDKGYQVINIEPDININYQIVSKDGTNKKNQFILNEDRVKITISNQNNGIPNNQSFEYYDITNLSTFVYVPELLNGVPEKYNSNYFVDDENTSYSVQVVEGNGSSKATVVTATSKVAGYIIPPIMQKISYFDIKTTKVLIGSLTQTLNNHDWVAFPSGLNIPNSRTAFTEITGMLNSNSEEGFNINSINSDFEIDDISVFANFYDDGDVPLKSQIREVKGYEIGIYDKNNFLIQTIKNENASGLTKVIYNNMPSNPFWNIFTNVLFFGANVVALALPGLGAASLLASVAATLASFTLQFAMDYALPALANLFVGIAYGRPDAALTTFGIRLKNAPEELLLATSITNFVASIGSFATNAFNFAKNSPFIANLFTKKISKSFGILKGFSLKRSFEIAEFSVQALNFIFDTFEFTENIERLKNSEGEAVAFGSANDTIDSIETLQSNLKTEANIDTINGYAVKIPTPGLKVPKGGSVKVKIQYANHVAGYAPSKLFRPVSWLKGYFKRSEGAVILFNGWERFVKTLIEEK